MPDRMPEDMPDRMPDRMPEDMSEYMPDRMPDRMPEDMSDRMPEDMPEDLPEDMSVRLPEDLPVRKCINVMVGITRSKVFVFISWDLIQIQSSSQAWLPGLVAVKFDMRSSFLPVVSCNYSFQKPLSQAMPTEMGQIMGKASSIIVLTVFFV